MNSYASTVRPLHSGARLPQVSKPVYVYRFSLRAFLLQLLFCTLPAAALLATGRAEWAGKCFWLLFGLVLLRAMLMGRRDELLCLILAAAPFLNLLRSFVFYNVIIAMFLVLLGFYFFSASNRFSQTLRQFGLFWGVVIWVGIYYTLSLYNTRDYAINLRLFELAFTVLCVLLLSRNRLLLGVALTGTIISAWLVGLAMIPQMGTSDRLGIIAVEGRLLGNPGQLGLPLAFGLLALMFDRGRWLHLQEKPMCRWLMLAPTAVLLALTTSRASWLVAAVGVLILLLFGKQQRTRLVSLCIVGIIGIGIVLMSPYGVALKKGWERTFGEGQSVRKKTSGRSDQWMVSEYAFTRSINSIIHGHGPGRGPEMYAKYSPEVPGVQYAVGKRVALHSLFMQLLVEVGLVGLISFLAWLLMIFSKIGFRVREHGLFPMACFFAYALTMVSVSGNDINSGILLGMALLGTAYSVARIDGVRGPDNMHLCTPSSQVREGKREGR
ncbi:MAG: O-antigen ligase family protein [Verrucomicrobia bacterium]|nr:O-antigen ligase family protein [Verrucomicrobiota bacterium]